MNPADYARVKDVYQRAVGLSTPQRASFLDEACGQDTELRREVESLLRNHDSETILPETRHADATQRQPSRRDEPSAVIPLVRSATVTAALLGNARRRAGAVAITTLLLGVLGIWLHYEMRNSLRRVVGEHLAALVNADVLALDEWIEQRKLDTLAWAQHRVVAQSFATVRNGDSAEPDVLRKHADQTLLRELFEHELCADDSAVFSLIDRRGQVLASNFDASVGWRLNPDGTGVIAHVWEGETLFVGPHRQGAWVSVAKELVKFRALTWVFAPVRDSQGEIVAALGIGKYADLRFSDILGVARPGQTGETYAFDQEGQLLSESRFNDQLRTAGLIPDRADSRSMLQLTLRDPGGNLLKGYRSPRDLDTMPLTTGVATAVASRTKPADQQRGQLLDAYRDYRGVDVIGAWRWLPEYRIGVICEMDTSEADAPLGYLARAVAVLFGLLVLSLTVSFASSFAAARWRKAAAEARQLGPYTLVKKLGEGGMGEVHLAQHALLKRPTAIKLIKTGRVTADTIARFEREAQVISQLTHPNTLEIYDFGRTPDGVFYLAMEYLPGLTLADLVARYGPVVPSRTIHILRQMCGSLREAHELGLVHRDIKPQNVILTRQGGEYDVAKVLDFGLAKQLEAESRELTSPDSLMGTPMYMSPERFRDPQAADARTDIFAVGAVGYYLASGRHAFDGDSLLTVFKHVMEDDPPPVTVSIPPRLDELLRRCLAKAPEQRPASMAEILDALEPLARQFPWSQAQAAEWWREHTEDVVG